MLGAIIGDIVGSIYEFENIKTKDFPFFGRRCTFTDDSVMTIAVYLAIKNAKSDYSDLEDKAIYYMQKLGREYPNRGYGGNFRFWLINPNPKPYNSFGNGSAMRVSPCGFYAKSLEEAKLLSAKVTKVSHNHPEGMKGAEATAVAIYLARNKKTKEEIKEYINKHYYKIDFTLDEIRPVYFFNEICQKTVPQALEAFFEANSYEDAIRNAISIGGDSDTLAAITGAVAEAYFGIPEDIKNKGISYLDDKLKDIVNDYYANLNK